MKSTKKGFIPVMLTPFKNDGSIDFKGLTKLTELYIESGASGLFANCLSSEMFELYEDERIEVVRHVMMVSNGAVPVVATGTFGGSISHQASFVKKIYDEGVESVILITGVMANEDDDEEVFETNVCTLIDLTGNIPLGFYECPVPYKRLISPAQLGRLVKSERLTFHKDTSLDIEQVKEKVRLTSAYKFGLYDAYMVNAVKSLEAGAAGLSCIQGNFFPELISWLCENYNKVDLKYEVKKVQQFFIDHMTVMHDVYPTISKYALQIRGLDISTFTRRSDIGYMDAELKGKVIDLMKKYSELKNGLELRHFNISII
jgi:4-hydroxy-tetrahydrodipicolinate synthase